MVEMFFLWLFLIYYNLHGIYTIRYNVTLVYDIKFKDQIKLAELYKIHENVTWKLKVTMPNDSLQELTNIDNHDMESDMYLLFHYPFGPLIELLSPSSNSLVLKYGNSLMNMENSRHDDACIKFNPSLRQAITYLIFSLFKPHVSIVTDESACAEEFFTSLVKSVKKHIQYKLLHAHLNHITYNHQKLDNLLSNQLYSIKSSGIQLVMLLTPNMMQSNVFSDANHFGLLGANPLWIIPDFNDNGRLLLDVPSRILSFTVNRDYASTPYLNVTPVISDAVRTYLGSKEKRDLRRTEEIVEHKHINNMKINLRYRNKASRPTEWVCEEAEIIGNEFLVHGTNFSFLKSFTPTENSYRRIKVVTVIDEPFTFEDAKLYDPYQKKCETGLECVKHVKDENGVTSTEMTCCVGLVIDIFTLAIKDIGLEVDVYVVEDGNYGSLNDKGEWDGMMNDVLQGKADIAIAGLTITELRQKYVDFTLPFLEAEMGVIVRPIRKTLEFVNFEFISPLSGELQLILWIVIVGAMVLNYLFENNLYAYSLISNETEKQTYYYTTFESMTYISGVTLQRDLGGVNPKRAGARVSAIIFAFGMVIVVTTYTAVLAAQSVQDQEHNPFKGSRDARMRNPTSKFRFGLLKSSSYDTFFKKSQVDTYKRMSNFMLPYNVKTTFDGVERVKNGSLEAYIGDYQFLYWYVSNDQSCELRVQKDTLMQGGYGFAMNKDFQHASNINQAVIKYAGSYELNNIYQRWFTNACRDTINNPTMFSLDINHFGGLFLLLCATILCCFPLLIPEHWYFRYFQDRLTQRIKRIFEKEVKPKTELTSANERLATVLECERERSFSVVEAIRKRAEALAKFD